jgi:hypothetical protein
MKKILFVLLVCAFLLSSCSTLREYTIVSSDGSEEVICAYGILRGEEGLYFYNETKDTIVAAYMKDYESFTSVEVENCSK